jgi:hypothetical protein
MTLGRSVTIVRLYTTSRRGNTLATRRLQCRDRKDLRCDMRRKPITVLRLEPAPANCNHKGQQEPARVTGARVRGGHDCDMAGPSEYQGLGGAALQRVAIARRRLMWVLARELCTTASLYRVGGFGSAASQSLRSAFQVLRDRAGIAGVEKSCSVAEGE